MSTPVFKPIQIKAELFGSSCYFFLKLEWLVRWTEEITGWDGEELTHD